jgi:hypothetical protein
MENISNKRILIAIGFVMLLAVVVLIWYFFYAKPVITRNVTETNNPLPTSQLPPRFQFLNWGDNDQSTTTTEVIDPLSQPLVQIWDKPSTGQAFITQNVLKEITVSSSSATSTATRRTMRATSTVIVFIDRMTGYVYGYSLDSGKSFQISNTLVPGVYDGYIFDNGRKVIMRYYGQDKIKTAALIANIPNVEENEMPLPLTNIQYITSPVTDIAANTRREKIAYISSNEVGSSIYTVSSKGGGLVTTSPFKEWNLTYGGDDLFATPKASAYVLGTTFSVPSFQPEVSDKSGLITNTLGGGVFINSMWSTQGLTTFITNNGSLQVLSIKTLASKCGWGENRFLVCAVPKTFVRKVEGLPDDWYQGRVFFDDSLSVIDSATGDEYPLYTFSSDLGTFDVTNILISKNNTLVSFTKKQDGSLWMLNTALLEDYGGN